MDDELESMGVDILTIKITGRGRRRHNRNSGEEDKDNDYEQMCAPSLSQAESKAGKLINLAKGICICSEMSYAKNHGYHQNSSQDFSKIPGFSFINLADLQNMIPQSRR